MMLRALVVACLIVAGLAPGATHAHATSTGLAQVRITGDGVSVRLTLPLDELPPDAARTLAGAMNRDMGGAETVVGWLGNYVVVESGGRACKPVRYLMQGSAASASRAVTEVGYQCPDLTGTLIVSDHLQSVFGEHYRTIVSLHANDGSTQEQVLQDGRHSARFDRTGGPPPSGWLAFIRLGASHIAGGFDHLVFLVALMLGARRAGSALAVITAFTVAHSLTLALAVYGGITLAPVIVEPLIAVSIIWAGTRLALGSTRDRDGWPLAFGFGLVHGMGFAGALTELKLPHQALLRALVGFNVGVELAQLALVLISAPLWWWLWRQPAGALPARLMAIGVILAGVGWLVQRLLVAGGL